VLWCSALVSGFGLPPDLSPDSTVYCMGTCCAANLEASHGIIRIKFRLLERHACKVKPAVDPPCRVLACFQDHRLLDMLNFGKVTLQLPHLEHGAIRFRSKRSSVAQTLGAWWGVERHLFGLPGRKGLSNWWRDVAVDTDAAYLAEAHSRHRQHPPWVAVLPVLQRRQMLNQSCMLLRLGVSFIHLSALRRPRLPQRC
jgi:hypothetical protein